MPATKHELSFYTSYRQFYLADKGLTLKTNSVAFWTQAASDARLAIEDGVLGIGTECYGPVKATLLTQYLQTTDFTVDAFDHIVEGSIRINSGILQVLNCPDLDVELEVSLIPGEYRVRIYSSNLSSVIGDEGEDSYQLEVWPDAISERKLIKKYSY